MQQPLECFTFTGRFPVYRRRISSMIHVSPSRDTSAMMIKVRALWDTGASNSIISGRLAGMLNMTLSDSSSRLRSALGFESDVKDGEAWIIVVMGSFPVRLKVKVVECPSSDDDIDVVLGLDFITKGDFNISLDGEQLMFSFCYPSGFPMDFHECLSKLEIPHAHSEDENADGSLSEAIRKGEALKLNYKP